MKFGCKNFCMEKQRSAIQLMKEMMLHSDFSDEARMHELIASQRSRLEMRNSNTGNVLAAGRNGMFFSAGAYYR